MAPMRINLDDPVPEPRLLEPHQLGWLRRPELDTETTEVWERPDGVLHAHDPKQGRLMLNFFKVPR